jgi:diguanylate cyclase
MRFFEDPSGKLTAKEILNQNPEWRVNHEEVLNRGFNNSTWWFDINLTNKDQATDWLFIIEYPILDYAHFNVYQNNKLQSRYSMGDRIPFSSRPIDNRYLIIPLTIKPSESQRILIQVQTSGTLNMPVALWKPEAFTSYDSVRLIANGIYFGALLIIAAYNLLLYLALGDRPYIYYVGYVLCIALFVGGLDGWNFKYLWPWTTGLNDYMNLIIISSASIFGLLFTRRFLELSTFSKLLDRSLLVLMVVTSILILSTLIFTYAELISFLAPLVVVCCVFAFISGVVAMHNKKPAAKYYTAAWVAFFIGAIALALSSIGVLPVNVFTKHAVQAGSLMEVLLLSFALAERINNERAMRIKAQQDALELQVQSNEQLEERVQERTIALERALQKLEELSNTDQLTGIKNRRFMDSFLEQEFSRALRNGKCISIMLMDVDHFKSVNDTHGHLVGDECLKEIAKRISDQVGRSADLVARYGGEEFCVILPDTDYDGTKSVAERIRMSVEVDPISTSVGPLSLTISVGGCISVPSDSDKLFALLEEADKALYESKKQGRNLTTLINISC